VAEKAHLIAQTLAVPVERDRSCALCDRSTKGHNTERNFGLSRSESLVVGIIVAVFGYRIGSCIAEDETMEEDGNQLAG